MLHENTVERIEFAPAQGELRIIMSQLNPVASYPDDELLLTFSGVREFHVEGVSPTIEPGDDVLSMQSEKLNEFYVVRIFVGRLAKPCWRISVSFSDLRYRRSKHWP